MSYREPASHKAVMELIAKLAARGARCLPNSGISRQCGLKYDRTANTVLRDLESAGRIEVERTSNMARRLRIAGGEWTGWSIPPKGGLVVPHRRPRRAPGSTTPEFEAVLEMQRVDRSPCPLCGIRADIGCRHTKGTSQ